MKKQARVFLIGAAGGFLTAFSGTFLSTSLAWSDESHPGLAEESMYSEAVLDYDRQQTAEALRILDQLIEKHPDYAQALELKALTLKGLGQDKGSLATYLKVIQLKPVKERGPYYFEAAVLLRRLGKTPEAIEYFEASIKLGFNVSASHLFLGMLYYNNGDPKKAESHFHAVEGEGLPEMLVVAHYYLGVIYLKEGYPATGVHELEQAKETAQGMPENKTASDTLAAVNQILEPFGHSLWFANISLLGQYDSNVSEVPNVSAAQTQASSSSTGQVVLSGGAGYMSPARAEFQWVPSYQFDYNNNFTQATKQYDYFTNVGSLYLNYRPLSQISGGFKIQGYFTFQNAPNDPNNLDGTYTLTKYSLSGDIGPYVKIQLSPSVQFESDLDIKPQDYWTETVLSGTDYAWKATLRGETSNTYLNPGGTLSLENDSASSIQYKYRSIGWSFFDVLRPTVRDTLTLALDLTMYNYYESAPSRHDFTINPHLSILHVLSDKWAIVGDVGYTTNASTLSTTYSYNRFVGGAGISRTL